MTPAEHAARFRKKAPPREFTQAIKVGQRFTVGRVECVVTYTRRDGFSARPVGSLGDKVRSRPGSPESRLQELASPKDGTP